MAVPPVVVAPTVAPKPARKGGFFSMSNAFDALSALADPVGALGTLAVAATDKKKTDSKATPTSTLSARALNLALNPTDGLADMALDAGGKALGLTEEQMKYAKIGLKGLQFANKFSKWTMGVGI